MIPEREKICLECSGKPSIHHMEYPYCRQPTYPITEDEWKEAGITRDMEVTPETVERMMDISLQPYCKRLMLNAHPIQWWTDMIKGMG